MKRWPFGAACATLVVGLTLARPIAQQPPENPTFEVSVLRPSAPGPSFRPPFGLNRWSANSVTLPTLMSLSFDVQLSIQPMVGLPDWALREFYSIAVKAEDGVLLTRDALRPRLRRFIEERFKLVTHIETRKVKGYALVVAGGGPKLKTAEIPQGTPDRNIMTAITGTGLRSQSLSMYFLARQLGGLLGDPVVDETGLTDHYDVTLRFAREPIPGRETFATDSSLPSLFTALQEQLGLRLVSKDGIPVDTLVIDHVEHPIVD